MMIRGVFIILIALLSSCTANKFLQGDEKYYDGAAVSYKSARNLENASEVKYDVNKLLRPKPNTRLLGMRPRVWFYQVAGETNGKGLKNWIKTKLGKKPVFIQNVDYTKISNQIHQTLVNNGYFFNKVSYSLKERTHKVGVKYKSNISEPYHYDTIQYKISDSTILNSVRSSQDQSLLKINDRYDLEKLRAERRRLEKVMKDLGFYHFNSEYLLFRADTTIGQKKIDLRLKLKETMPEQARKIYTTGEVNLFNQSSAQNNDSTTEKTVASNNINYHYTKDEFRPEILTEQVTIKPGNLYNKEYELVTLNRLIQLDVFKYVNIEYEEDSTSRLNTNIYLTPFKKKSIRLELQAVSKSNNFVGPNFTATFKNRNIFRGAESYQLNIDAGYEVQVGGNSNNNNNPLNSYIIGLENILTVPRILSPLNIKNKSSLYVPMTVFKLGFRTLQRVNFFTLNSINLAYGFNWRETDKKRHELYPADIGFIQLGSVSSEFDSVLNQNPLLRSSYEEQFILGTKYSFFYNTQNDEDRDSRSDFYFNVNADLSGNLMHLAQSIARSEPNAEEEPYTILGSAYSQYVKGDIDTRFYYNIGKGNRIATRLVAGIGYAFGNSNTLPYTKQFTIGGATSIRAFRARSVGPGRYQIPDTVTFIDQTADIKFEANFEYRFPIIGAFKGALFSDVGNIWTIREDEQRPGSQFDPTNFLGELAVGAGFGLRFDAELFVIRLDLATPLRIPSRSSGDRWVLSDIAIDQSDWRRENLVLNIAIGYPF